MSFETGYALVIGVGKYQYIPHINVPIVGVDVAELAVVLGNPAYCGYPKDQITLLSNELATRRAVLDALKTLAAKLGEKDTLFLFYVGHGGKGTDGQYYLTTHDSQVAHGKVKKGTGISEPELIDCLRKFKSKRMLVILNSCHSGEVSPSLDLAVETFSSEPPPEKLTAALLSSGDGRIIITACRPDQKSWIGKGKLSIFSQAVVNGLKGESMYVIPNGGTISAYNLYEHVYFAAKEAAEKLGWEQDPELTVLRGVGPFPVALYQGASDLGTFNIQEPIPAETAAKQVDPAISQRLFERTMHNYQATLTGDGAIAQGTGAKAVGAGGIMIEGNVKSS